MWNRSQFRGTPPVHVAAYLVHRSSRPPHTLRHTFATDLYRETKNIRLVQKALGHADLTSTMIYTHIVDEELEEALRGFRAGLVAA